MIKSKLILHSPPQRPSSTKLALSCYTVISKSDANALYQKWLSLCSPLLFYPKYIHHSPLNWLYLCYISRNFFIFSSKPALITSFLCIPYSRSCCAHLRCWLNLTELSPTSFQHHAMLNPSPTTWEILWRVPIHIWGNVNSLSGHPRHLPWLTVTYVDFISRCSWILK